jgi:hypothetical protein
MKTITLIAELSAGVTGEAGPDFKDGNLPPSYEKAMDPYAKRGDKAGAEVCKNLSGMVKAVLFPENFSRWNEIFSSSKEIQAESVMVIGFEFDGESNLPEINALAHFEVQVNDTFSEDALREVEERAGESLGEAVNFYWEFSDNPYKDWDGSLINNSGIEVSVSD